MNPADCFRVEVHPQYGVLARCLDREVADAFDDFLVEQDFDDLLFGFEGSNVVFYFGLAISRDRVEDLIARFSAEPWP